MNEQDRFGVAKAAEPIPVVAGPYAVSTRNPTRDAEQNPKALKAVYANVRKALRDLQQP